MKVAIIAPPWNVIPPPKYGGSESMIDYLARGLHRAGHDVVLIALEGSTCPVPSKYVVSGSQDHAFSPVCHEIDYVTKAYDLAIEAGADVIHDSTTMGPLYARAFPDIAFVTTNHGPFEGVLTTLYEKIWPWCSIVSISQSHSKKATMPVTVIHHGVDTERFTFGEGKGDEKGEYFFFMGRMQWIKGPEIAARVAKAAGKRLVIAAKMDEEPEIKFFHEHVKPLLDDNVEFIGEVGGEQKIDLLRNAKALLNPIQWPEPFGLVMAEALSCGTPVIATNNGAAPEIVEDGVTGFICETEEQLVEACRNIDTIDRVACRKSAEAYFNVERMANDHVRLYEQIIASKGRNGTTEVIDLTDAASPSVTSKLT